jgi:hypothetical protein
MDTTETRTVREPRTTGTVTTNRGASAYAPGQVKKRSTTVTRSAREFSPGVGGERAPGQMMMQEQSNSRVRVR